MFDDQSDGQDYYYVNLGGNGGIGGLFAAILIAVFAPFILILLLSPN